MKKLIYLCALFVSINLLIANVYAFVDARKVQGSDGEELRIATFLNNEPFGKVIRQTTLGGGALLDGVFLPELEEFAKANRYILVPKSAGDTIADIRAVRAGDIDLLVGMYYATKLYSGIEYIFPAMVNNPVHIAMMPENISKVTSKADLGKLRGVRIKNEVFSDYVEKELKKLNLQTVETPDEAFRQIFVGDADYVLGGYYYLLMESIKLGVRSYISFSQKALWDIPVFIGVSKMSPLDRKTLIKLLTAWSNNKTVKGNVEAAIKKKIDDLQEKYSGTVPPMYIRSIKEGEIAPSMEDLPVVKNPNAKEHVEKIDYDADQDTTSEEQKQPQVDDLEEIADKPDTLIGEEK